MNQKTKSERVSSRTRASLNRQVRQEGIREQLKALEYLRQIQNDYETLGKLFIKIKSLKAKTVSKKLAISMNRLEDYNLCRFELEKCMAQREVIRLKLDTNYHRLRFCLPELKSIELTDPGGNNPFSQFLDMMVKATKDSSK